jgi:hypothetical protein
MGDDLHPIDPIHDIGGIPIDAVVMWSAQPIAPDDRVVT